MTEGPSSLETLEDALQDFKISQDEDGRTTVTFTSSSPTFRLDYALERRTCCSGPYSDTRYVTGSKLDGVYAAKLRRNGDGSVNYTITLEAGVEKACINLGRDRYLFDPRQIAEALTQRRTREYDPPGESPLLPQSPNDLITKPEQVALLAETAAHEALGLGSTNPIATHIDSRFVPAASLEPLIPEGNTPEAVQARNDIIRPSYLIANTGNFAEPEIYFNIPRRYGPSQQAGVLLVRESDLVESLESIQDVSVRSAIRAAYHGIATGEPVEKWRVIPNDPSQPESQFQMRTDGSVTVRPLMIDGTESPIASIWGPRFVNGRLTWRKVDARLNTDDQRYYPASGG